MTGGEKDTRDEAGGGAGDRRRALETEGGKNTERRLLTEAEKGRWVERRLQVDGPNFKSGASGGGHRG